MPIININDTRFFYRPLIFITKTVHTYYYNTESVCKVLLMEPPADIVCYKFSIEIIFRNSCEFKIANPSIVFSMHMEVNNKLTFRPTFTEMTSLLGGKMWVLITVLVIMLLT